MLSVEERGVVLLLEWENFHTLLPLEMDFDALERLQKDPRLVQVEVQLLAEDSLASLNPPEWIGKLRPQVVLLSAGANEARSQPDPEMLQAVEGYTLLRIVGNPHPLGPDAGLQGVSDRAQWLDRDQLRDCRRAVSTIAFKFNSGVAKGIAHSGARI